MVAVPCESGETDAQTFPARLGQLTSPRRNFHRESEAGLFLPMIPSHFIRLGDCLDVLKTMPDNSVDSIVTDPPYGLSFMGKKWDYDVPSTEIWAECLRVLKPGGHLLAFAGTRTQHRMAVRIEDAGFEIRDMIAWIYGSGFPKSLDISKQLDKAAGAEGDREFLCVNPASRSGNAGSGVIGETATTATGWRKPIRPDKTSPATEVAQQWDGWGTALKPAMEPITVARKPLDGTVAANVLEWGTGGLNINGCRVEFQCDSDKDSAKPQGRATTKANGAAAATPDAGRDIERIEFPIKQHAAGRWPANLIHDGSQMVMDLFPQTKSGKAAAGGHKRTAENMEKGSDVYGNGKGIAGTSSTDDAGTLYGDSGSAARFFYCAKSSRSERDSGLDGTLTVKHNTGLCKDKNTELVRLLQRATEESIVKWHIGESGESITGQCRSDSLSTTLTEISRITTSETFNSSPLSTTNEFTADASNGTESGGSRAESAAPLSQSQPTTTSESPAESALGASPVVSKMLSEISVAENWKPTRNEHSTVKPLALMRYLVRLVTPPEGTTLDPFLGSGTTALAALQEGFSVIGIERDEHSHKTAMQRILNR